MRAKFLFLPIFSLFFCYQALAHNAKGGTRRINERTHLYDTDRVWKELWSLDLKVGDGDFMQVSVDLEIDMRECRAETGNPCRMVNGKPVMQLRPNATVRLMVLYPHPTKPDAFASVSIDKPLKSLITSGGIPFKREWKQTVHMSVNIPHVTSGEALVRVMGIQNDKSVPSLPIWIRNLSTFRIPK